MTLKPQNPERDLTIYNDRRAGMPLKLLAAEHGISYARIRQIIYRQRKLEQAKGGNHDQVDSRTQQGD